MRILRSTVVGLLKRWGPEPVRVKLWDAEFERGQWDRVESTTGDYLYGFLERYLRGGALLDLGCGSGNTGNELAADAYSRYVGVDISSIAVKRARERSRQNGREPKNLYELGDLLSFSPSGQYDVILFRESLYYVPTGQVRALVNRYAASLKEDGVFLARVWNRFKHASVVDRVTRDFRVLECAPHDSSRAIVLAFQSPGHRPHTRRSPQVS